jgi:hypothetical protein
LFLFLGEFYYYLLISFIYLLRAFGKAVFRGLKGGKRAASLLNRGEKSKNGL